METKPSTEPAKSTGKRTPKDVIDGALKETAGWEWICWYGCIASGIVGLAAVVVGFCRGDAWVGLTGAIPGAGVFGLMRYAAAIRKENISLRLMELALNNTKTAEDATRVLSQVYSSHFAPKGGKDHVVPKTG